MDLKEFVSDTLVQICEGIKDAQDKTKEMGAYVSPMLTAKGTATAHGGDATGVSRVRFDVALEVVDESKSGNTSNHKAGLKIFCAHTGLDGSNENHTTDKETHVSKVSFEVPVVWPTVPIGKEMLGGLPYIDPRVLKPSPYQNRH